MFSELQSLLMRETKVPIPVSTQLFLTVAGEATMSRSCKFISGAMSRCGEFGGTAYKFFKTKKKTAMQRVKMYRISKTLKRLQCFLAD